MRKLDKFLNLKIPIGKKRDNNPALKVKVIDFAFVLCVIILSLNARLALFPMISGDYVGFLGPWLHRIRELGGFYSLGHEISNYSSAYMIIMSFLSYLNADPLYSIKAVSVFFDYVAALAVFSLLFVLTESPRRAIIGMSAFLMMPTGILNSAYWGQCDMIYAAFVLLGLCYYCRGSTETAMWLTAVAFAFKLQALFILPFYIIMWLRPYIMKNGERATVKLYHFLPIPIPYLLFTIPGIFFGRDIWNSIGVYFLQAGGYYPWLTLNYPNIYAFFGQTYLLEPQIAELGRAGLLTTILALGTLAYFIYVKNVRMNANMMVTTALFSLCLLLYGLPHMHERYGILIDVLAVVYAVLRPRQIPVAIGLITSSLMSYMLFLFGRESLPPLHHAIFQLGLIIFVGRDLYRQAMLQHKNPVLKPAQAELVITAKGDSRNDGIKNDENNNSQGQVGIDDFASPRPESGDLVEGIPNHQNHE